MNNNYESHAISRRSFLKASGVVGAAGILAACGGNSGSSSTAASSGATSAPNTTGATPLKEFISWEMTNRELEHAVQPDGFRHECHHQPVGRPAEL